MRTVDSQQPSNMLMRSVYGRMSGMVEKALLDHTSHLDVWQFLPRRDWMECIKYTQLITRNLNDDDDLDFCGI